MSYTKQQNAKDLSRTYLMDSSVIIAASYMNVCTHAQATTLLHQHASNHSIYAVCVCDPLTAPFDSKSCLTLLRLLLNLVRSNVFAHDSVIPLYGTLRT